MDSCDEAAQRKAIKFQAMVSEGKLLLEINDGVTYKGEIASSPYYDISQLKALFEKGEAQVLFKTTSKMSIKISILKVDLQSEENRQLQELKDKIKELEEKTKNLSQWQQEDLGSTSPFDLNYIYKIDTTSGWSLTSIGVSTSTLQFTYSGSNYTTSSSNRRANSTGWAVTRMMKHKIV